jgi:PAS domain S-box-containing protein
VTNAKIHDNPIEYCSESFERLTGYTKHEIRGKNCRFLQSPDGTVSVGIKRKYCDDDSVLYLKNCIASQTEAQISLINYRKGGQPFMNLLTMIPIYDEGGEVSHFVGFQVDLVENPMAINSKNPGKKSILHECDYCAHKL